LELEFFNNLSRLWGDGYLCKVIFNIAWVAGFGNWGYQHMFVLAWVLALFYTGCNNIVEDWSEIITETLEYRGRTFVYSGRFPGV
jgi:hypothetical protein